MLDFQTLNRPKGMHTTAESIALGKKEEHSHVALKGLHLSTSLRGTRSLRRVVHVHIIDDRIVLMMRENALQDRNGNF